MNVQCEMRRLDLFAIVCVGPQSYSNRTLRVTWKGWRPVIPLDIALIIWHYQFACRWHVQPNVMLDSLIVRQPIVCC